MEKFIEHCCEECTNTKDNPCEKFIECCMQGPLCHENESCKKKRQTIIGKIVLNEDFLNYDD
ncbi:CCxxC motif-containing NuoF prefix domain-containing protein [Candidatus Contubernalis alkaliaceticus]|uniref:CCxxC motif-containing NuoF prefix domain-containing protein n=1 Tax=Candidatus Contubernalis alkaliaceticus TaxID=338645 RepID=UPI001F4C47B2|nr:CCxxC motif-containing NuoF prefix domain-containing protein [Candidatus Contubernalis alkalaceticus]UNC91479.1 hypothetical protein HUE98_04880 [Candidatus Contubernalis alkalaceticus]